MITITIRDTEHKFHKILSLSSGLFKNKQMTEAVGGEVLKQFERELKDWKQRNEMG